jgi:hypothetical protein
MTEEVNHKGHSHEGHNHEEHTPEHVYKLAFIIDGEVVDTLKSHERLGAILLSDPLIVDITDKEVNIGDAYNSDNGEFLHE